MSIPRLIVLTVALFLLGAATAGANTLGYGGSSDSTDPSIPFIPFDVNAPTACGQTPNINDFPQSAHFDLYAFRNASASSDCITVTGSNPDCATEGTYDVTLTADSGSFLGVDSTSACNGSSHAHSFTAGAGQTFIEAVFGQ